MKRATFIKKNLNRIYIRQHQLEMRRKSRKRETIRRIKKQNKIKELGEDLTKLDIEIRLVTQQRDKKIKKI